MREVTRDGEVDFGGVELGVALDDGVVDFVGVAFLELATEHGLGGFVFGEDDDARGAAVEPMDEKAELLERGLGAKFALSHAKETGGLVDDFDVGVFVDDGGGDFLAEGRVDGGGEDDFGGFFESGVGFFDGVAVDRDPAFADEFLEG